ncbi:kinase-like domain-containing protein [Tribonema minus]|uniref:Kinase-like domain-containing protein n=1 Tax=Tribonema minus TaxID=303371 RepID=A0A835Z4Q1_9STRA|nr:kinase-like domain-containing protein [Tribonema minus]
MGDIFENYKVTKTLGIGSSGEVVLAEDCRDGSLYAVKIIPIQYIHTNHLSNQLKREKQAMKSLQHPNIVSLHRVLKGGSKLHLVCEYVPGGDLFDKIISQSRLPEEDAKRYFGEIVSAIAHCHASGISHRDIKPENCLMTHDDHIKVTDFGLSNVKSEYHEDMFYTVCGTPNYAAPEVLSRIKYKGPVADIWSLGVLLYVMLIGMLPFDEEAPEHLWSKIKHAEFSIPEDSISEEAEDLINMILVADPVSRPNLDAVLAHPWFTVAEKEVKDKTMRSVDS